jgi:hypothetical protein
MSEWLKVAFGTVLIIVAGAGPGLFYEWSWESKQAQTAQTQLPPTGDRPNDTRARKNNAQGQSTKTVQSETVTPDNTTTAPNLEQLPKQNEHPSPDEVGGDMNGILAAWATVAVTVGLLVVAGVQAGIYRRQARIMRSQLHVATVAARASRRSAEALPALERAYVFIEVNPNFVSQMQSRLQRQQTRQVVHEMNAELGEPEPQLTINTASPMFVEYQFVNHGKTPAIVKAMSAEFQHITMLPPKLNYNNEPIQSEIVIRAGDIYPPRAEDKTKSAFYEQLGIVGPRYFYFQKRVHLADGNIDANAAEDLRQGAVSCGSTDTLSTMTYSAESTKQRSAGAIAAARTASSNTVAKRLITELRRALAAPPRAHGAPPYRHRLLPRKTPCRYNSPVVARAT